MKEVKREGGETWREGTGRGAGNAGGGGRGGALREV